MALTPGSFLALSKISVKPAIAGSKTSFLLSYIQDLVSMKSEGGVHEKEIYLRCEVDR